jgi:predicted dinucleotide-binding enzyme
VPARAEVLVPLWVAAGHELIVGGRTPEKTADLAAQVGARAATLREAAEEAQVLVIGVLYVGVAETLAAAGAADGVLRGKVLVDVNNPVETEHFQLVDDFTPSLAEHLARVTGADVVKALNQVHRDVWSRRATYGGRPLVVPVATDSAAAREVADRLVLDAGATPFDAGPQHRGDDRRDHPPPLHRRRRALGVSADGRRGDVRAGLTAALVARPARHVAGDDLARPKNDLTVANTACPHELRRDRPHSRESGNSL